MDDHEGYGPEDVRLVSALLSLKNSINRTADSLDRQHGKNTTTINIFIIGGHMPLNLAPLIAELTADTNVSDELDTVVDAVVAAYSGATSQADIDAITVQLNKNTTRQQLKTAALKNLVGPGSGGGGGGTPGTLALAVLSATAAFGGAYSGQLVASGGTAPYTFAVTSGNLPSGLLLDAATGAISGVADAAGNSNFDASVTDSVGASAASVGNSISVS